MKNIIILVSAVTLTTGLVACDGPVEPVEAPVSQFPNADGVTFAGGPPAGGSRAGAAMAESQTTTQPRPDEDEETGEEVAGGAVEGSNESPAVGSFDPEETEEQASATPSEETASPVPEPKYTGSPATKWSGQGTGTLPKFGVNCRLETDDVFESPTNGLVDDTLLFTTHDANNATVDILVQDAWGEALHVNVDISRALTARSFRYATGTANYDDIVDVAVMDGTLCFEEKATPGQDVLVEFSFILNDGGLYTSVAGVAMVPGNAIGNLGGLSVDAEQTMEIDLR